MKIGRKRYRDILITDQEDGLVASITDEDAIVEDGYKVTWSEAESQLQKSDRRERRIAVLDGILIGLALGALFWLYTAWIISIGYSM